MPLKPSPHIFDRLITFDWYDGVLEGLVRCDECKQWFYTWTIAICLDGRGNPSSRRLYAFQPVSSALIDELEARLGQVPRYPQWAPKLDSSAREFVELVASGIQIDTEVEIGLFDGLLGTTATLRVVDLRDLNEWSHPNSIESLIEQPSEERSRLMQLLDVSD